METTRRWQRLEEIFHAALALDVEERPAYLAEACGDDDALRREAAELLESVGDADERIGGAVSAGLEVALEAIAGGVPETIGPYRILRELGEGGLANVYLGERTEGYTQQVAVKVLKRGMDTVDILRRLRQERQILADLDHPHIARLLDGGTTADGRPYVVMEHIEGEPIDDYCDRRGLTVQERLELFTKVCAAVHHAHRSLVIHRDIKPSNLLVTPEGNPKLLDFGIAKLLDPSRARATVAHTGAGIRWLTPGYASPEQVVGAPLTTATDIYSLGVLLYQLLTGRPPHRFPTDHPAEVERVMRDVEPQRPSAAAGGEPTEDGPGTRPAAERAKDRGTTPERLVKSLRGDLDNIVRMAMHAEPERRYASAEQLADDVANHLASMPVRARPETFGYYAAKFVRRHRGAVAAAVVVVLSLVGGIVGTTRALWIAETQRERAERLRDQSEEVAGFMIDLFRAPDPDIALGRDLSAWQLLENGAQRVEALDGQPLRQAALMHAMGRSYQNLGRYDEARSLLGRSLDRRREALGEGHPEVAGDLY
ncbi:MAG: protein kinase, partial [Acidobacteriota bacterium]